MKAYLFIETGEVRNPNNAEWFMANTEHPLQSEGIIYGDRNILTRHEIEIPEGAIGMIPLWQFTDGEEVGHKNWVPIPRPKKKVKKWQWLFRTDIDEIKLTSCRYRSEKDVFDTLGRHCVSILFPVMETEIEVEEA